MSSGLVNAWGMPSEASLGSAPPLPQVHKSQGGPELPRCPIFSIPPSHAPVSGALLASLAQPPCPGSPASLSRPAAAGASVRPQPPPQPPAAPVSAPSPWSALQVAVQGWAG